MKYLFLIQFPKSDFPSQVLALESIILFSRVFSNDESIFTKLLLYNNLGLKPGKNIEIAFGTLQDTLR